MEHSTDVCKLKLRIKHLEAENLSLKEQLDFHAKKHEQWKNLATIFHDTLWKMIDKYINNVTQTL